MTDWGPAEMMAVSMARLLRDGEVAFHGVNSILPMVAINLARRLHAPNLVYLNIAGGIDPSPRFLPESSTDPELTRGSAAILANEDFYDLCARGGVDTVFLGAVQVDPWGRTNVSVIGDWHAPRLRLPGGGGAAMIMTTARRTILWRTRHDRRTFVERLDFVTAAGNVSHVVTPLCVLERGPGGRLRLGCLHPGVTVEEVRRATGFPLPAEGPVPVADPPTAAELEALDAVDPRRVRRLEFA